MGCKCNKGSLFSWSSEQNTHETNKHCYRNNCIMIGFGQKSWFPTKRKLHCPWKKPRSDVEIRLHYPGPKAVVPVIEPLKKRLCYPWQKACLPLNNSLTACERRVHYPFGECCITFERRLYYPWQKALLPLRERFITIENKGVIRIGRKLNAPWRKALFR